MSIIGILTINNIRKSRRQINTLTIFTLSKTMKTRRDTNQLIKSTFITNNYSYYIYNSTFILLDLYCIYNIKIQLKQI